MHYQWVLRVVCILLGFYGKRGSLVLASSPLFHRNPHAHVLLLRLLWIQQNLQLYPYPDTEECILKFVNENGIQFDDSGRLLT